MNGHLASRDLLRVGVVLFGLFLVWRFLAEIAATALLLATGLLLAVALSGPVETLHRHKAVSGAPLPPTSDWRKPSSP